jgi:hypothetical protein
MTADPSSPQPPGPAEPTWEITLAGADGEDATEDPEGVPRRRRGLPRHCVGDVDEEFAPPADWRLQAWLAGVVAAVVAIVTATGWLVSAMPGAGSDVPPPPAATRPPEPPAAAESRNVVFVLTDGGGATVAAAVMGADSERATCLMAPRRLVLDVRGSGPTPLSSAFAASDAKAAAAVADTLGLRVDGAWRLSSKGLSDLVDSVGGVDVDTDVKVGPGGELVPGRGEEDRLRGDAAAEFATRAPRGLAEEQKLARFYAVLDGVLLALPDDARAREDKLAGLGAETESTLPDDQLYRLVGDLHRHVKAEVMEDQVLPVVRAAQGRPSGYDIDARRFRQLLEGPLAHVRRPVKVRVDATGEAAAVEAVRSRLEAARLVYEAGRATDVQTAATAAAAKTTITVGDSPSDLDRAQEVARVLGLPSSAIVVDKLRDVAYDVLVQVGADLEELLRLVGLTPTATPS